MAATSPSPRTAGPPTWPTRRVGAGLTQARKSRRTADLTKVRWARSTCPSCKKDDARLAARTTNGVVKYGGMVSDGEDKGLSAHGPEPAMPTQQTEAQTAPTGQARRFSTNILALEGGPMLQERPFGNSGAEHRSEPNHPQPAKEVTRAGPTLNRFWRMMTDPGFPSPASNLAPFVVTAEAFLGLTNQVQALAGMVQTIVPYLPQLIQSATQQSAPPTAFSQTSWRVHAQNRPPLPS
ncbi:hypothetical protein BHM03_00015383 [Ensete ventricosum]|nr:hypothetical protein BHM03_00015383 [Ensete ventricosum]